VYFSRERRADHGQINSVPLNATDIYSGVVHSVHQICHRRTQVLAGMRDEKQKIAASGKNKDTEIENGIES
jgi:hypothetical protein